jgi:hypothetical protein
MVFVKYEREFRLSGSYDVVVAGGGFAGVAAAVASARNGAKTLLIEHYGFLGGMATAGLVRGFWATLDGVGNILEEIISDLRKLDALRIPEGYTEEYLRYHPPGLGFDEEYLKVVLQDLVLRNEVELWLHSRVIDVIKRENKVEYLVVHSKSGIEAVKPEVVIDATGDGDVAALAGAEFKKGRESDSRQLAMSLHFKMCDTGKRVKPILPEGYEEYRSYEDLPFSPELRPKVIGLDPTNRDDLTKAEILARKQAILIVHYIQTRLHPTYRLVATATQIGIREGRRIIGDYVLTEEDIKAGRKFPDVIALGTSQIDFHDIDRDGDWGSRREAVPPYQIPYRCLLVKGIENMLTAGRCISGDQVAQSSYRMIPTCAATGQAAGTAAALAVKHQVNLRSINIKELQGILQKNGIKFEGVPPFVTPSGEAYPTPLDVQKEREKLARLDELYWSRKSHQ